MLLGYHFYLAGNVNTATTTNSPADTGKTPGMLAGPHVENNMILYCKMLTLSIHSIHQFNSVIIQIRQIQSILYASGTISTTSSQTRALDAEHHFTAEITSYYTNTMGDGPKGRPMLN